MEKEWITPKTDWKPTDKFNTEDFNRIKNNLEFLHELGVVLIQTFSIEEMGEDILSYLVYWNPDDFNRFERNLNKIGDNTYRDEFKIMQTFYENGIFIKYDELNRIETYMLNLKEKMGRHKVGLRKIPFTLGRFKEVRI